jgi:anaerobic selenocysteine-containing dehydrogenase
VNDYCYDWLVKVGGGWSQLSMFEKMAQGVQFNPTLREHPHPLNPLAPPEDSAFPIVATTMRLTEHSLSGPMSRLNSRLNELQPEMFVELSPELAAERGITNGGWMVITTPRGEIETRASVTQRISTLTERISAAAPEGGNLRYSNAFGRLQKH